MSSLNKYVGIPFLNMGRDFDGCDCWGLVRLFYLHEMNKELPLLDFYTNANDAKEIFPIVDIYKPLIGGEKQEIPKYGDIVVMKYFGLPCHVGVYVDNNKVLHVKRGIDSVIQNLNTLKGRIDGFYRPD
jgi:cell wall-associated NlpC family hydrolase